MKKNKNIDELFREGAAGFKIEPSIETWKNIEASHFWKKNKRVFPYWVILAALMVGVFLYLLLPVLTNNEEAETSAFVIDSIENKEVGAETGQIQEYADTSISDAEKNISLEKDKNEKFVQSEESNDISENSSKVNFGLNVANLQTGFDASKKYDDLNKLNSLSISGLFNKTDNYLYQHDIPGLEKYVEKKSNLHVYTGLGGTAGMMYYPATKDQFTYSADFAFGLKIKKVYMETGIGYQEMKEEGTVNIEFITKDSVGYYNEVLSFEVDPLNPSTILYNTMKTTVYDSVNHFTVISPRYQYSYLNFPFLVGYKIFDENKLILSAQAGVIFSTMIGESFQPIDVSNSDYQIVETINTTPSRVKNNLQMQLALRFGYRITPGLSVIAQPVFTKYLNSVYDTKAGYQNVKPYSMGLRIGVYYYF